MARNWKDVRADATSAGLIDEQRVRNAEKLIREAERAHRLADVRKAQARTQTELAQAMQVSQVQVSKIERGELARTQLGTLESYVEAMGGHLKVVAEFGDDTVTLQ